MAGWLTDCHMSPAVVRLGQKQQCVALKYVALSPKEILQNLVFKGIQDLSVTPSHCFWASWLCSLAKESKLPGCNSLRWNCFGGKGTPVYWIGNARLWQATAGEKRKMRMQYCKLPWRSISKEMHILLQYKISKKSLTNYKHFFFKSNANNPCETWNLCRSTRDWVVCYIVFKPVCSLVPAEWSCALVPSIKSPLVHWALRSDLLIIPRRVCLRDQHNMVVSGMESGLRFPAMLLLVDRHMALEIN